MAQKRKKFTKDQVAKKLGIQTYIMDSWEKQFEIEPTIKDGEQVYSKKQLAKFKSIKELLYEKGLAIDAAKKYIKDHTELEGTTLLAASPLNFDSQQKSANALASSLDLLVQTAPVKNTNKYVTQLRDKLNSVREQLINISNSL